MMPSEITMLLNLGLMGLAIYGIIRLAKKRKLNRPVRRKTEIDIVDDKLSNMANELKVLDARLKKEWAERD
ncbi:MAG: hypothetical protein ACM3O9_07380 [Methylocystaceae bacterium]